MGGTFRVEWKRRVDLPFESTHQMFNPLNEGKPVRICRDGQEVPHELGSQLTRMMDQLAQEHGIPPPRPAANAMQPAGAARSPQFSSPCLLSTLAMLMLNLVSAFQKGPSLIQIGSLAMGERETA